ncbi:hypothetical protein LIER_25685 [Lithospermum erythrorhizon]|uniref:Integrase catalytic domain-containing protein n=1 Tax=Lithospermum erythrorhizon TaxID=34254 RepID=A0AAV3R6Z0_LITER
MDDNMVSELGDGVITENAMEPPQHYYTPLVNNENSQFFNNQNEAQIDSNSFPNSDPLQLHHSDHPNYMLSTRLLNPNNYNHWRRSVEISLLAKNKIGFVTAECVRPFDPSLTAQWDRCNGMVIVWILHSVEKDIAESVIYCDTAEKIWSQLHSRLISAYFKQLQKLWDEYTNVIDDETSVFVHYQKLLQNQQVMQLLMGLNECHATIRGNILMMRPFPGIDEILQILLQEEKQREVCHAHVLSGEASAMFTNGSSFGRGRGVFNPGKGRGSGGARDVQGVRPRSNLYCDHCKMAGHTMQSCYKIHGYPPKRIAAQVGEKKLSKDQFDKLVNMLNVSFVSRANSSGNNHAMMAGTSFCFSVNTVKHQWIIDSGTTGHITPHLSLFQSYKPMSPPPLITIPDGTQVPILHIVKSNVFPILEAFIAYVSTQFNTQVKAIKSDNAPEFTGRTAMNFYTSKGIIHQSSCVHTPQQNDIVERKHKHLLETSRALLFQSNLSIMF